MEIIGIFFFPKNGSSEDWEWDKELFQNGKR